MLRKLCVWLVALCAITGLASAQEADGSYDFGRRVAGEVHRASLAARNANCPQELDFRFEFAPSAWLRPSGDPRVRNVPTGESRSLPLTIDLTQMPEGCHTAEVDIVCENCRQFFLLTNCRFDRQHLTLTVEAIAAPAQPASPPSVTAPPPRRTQPAPPQTATPEVEPEPHAPEPSAPAPTAGATAPVAATPPAACDCAAQTATLTAAAIIAGLAALGFAAWGFSAARTASALAKSGAEAAQRAADASNTDEAPQRPSEQEVEGLQELLDALRTEVTTMLRAQFGAMRALSRIGAADPATIAGETDAWTKLCKDSGHALNETGDTLIAGRSAKALSSALQAGDDAASRDLFAAFFAPTQYRARLDWLREHGFATNDAEAQLVLNEMSSFAAQGASMSDMNERLREALDDCRQAEADLAGALAGLAGGG